MTQRRRMRSEMYQVDFVAALFGAFLLLWISKMGSGHGSSEVTMGVVVFQAWCKNNNGSLLPQQDLFRCASPDLVRAADTLIDVSACDALPVSNVTQTLKGIMDDTEILRDSLGLAKAPVARGYGVSAHVKFYAEDGRVIEQMQFGGLAIAGSADPTVEVAVGYGPTTAPAFVSIEGVDRAYIAVDCDAVSSQACGPRLQLFEGPYNKFHEAFNIRVQSPEWVQKCRQSDGPVKPDGKPHLLKACTL